MSRTTSRLAAHCRAVTFATLVGAMVAFSGGPLAAGPQAGRIDGITPAAGRRGDRLTIRGIGFGGPNVRITVGGVAAQIVAANGHEVTFVVPARVPAGATMVTATNPGGRSGSIAFQILEGILLSGGPNAFATDAMTELRPVAADADDVVDGVILTRLDVHLTAGATVLQINTALQQIDGGIVTMLHGFPGLTIGVPRQADAEALEDLAHVLERLPGIAHASAGREAVPNVLPPQAGGDINNMSQLLPTTGLGGVPAGRIRGQLISDTGSIVATIERPISDAGFMPAVHSALTGFGAIATLNVVLAEAASIPLTFTEPISFAGFQTAVPGQTLSATLGTVGFVNAVAVGFHSTVSLIVGETTGVGAFGRDAAIQVSGGHLGRINVGGGERMELTLLGAVNGININATTDSTIAISGISSAGFTLRGNTNLSLDPLSAGEIEQIVLESNSFRFFGGITAGDIVAPPGFPGSVTITSTSGIALDKIQIGNIARDLTLVDNIGFDSLDAAAFARARRVGGLITISGNRK
jgi:hypothetical protein